MWNCLMRWLPWWLVSILIAAGIAIASVGLVIAVLWIAIGWAVFTFIGIIYYCSRH